MTGITHGQNKFALNSTSSFALLVECAITHDRAELRLNWNDGRVEKDEGCRWTGRREIVEDKESEGVGEGEARGRQAGRKGEKFAYF